VTHFGNAPSWNTAATLKPTVATVNLARKTSYDEVSEEKSFFRIFGEL
jgi:hypothetical protein